MCKKDNLILYLLKYYCNHEKLDFNEIYTKLENHDIVINNVNDKVCSIESLTFDDILIKSFSNSIPSIPTTILDNYDLINIIGNGAYGKVYKAFNKIDCQSYALKIIKINTEKDNYECFLRESRYMALLEHPNIIRYYTSWIGQINNKHMFSAIKFSKSNSNSYSNYTDYSLDNKPCGSILSFLFIKMELCSHDLSYYLSTRNSINYKEVINIYTQIVLGVNYLHNKNIIHRDLKPSNIFITHNKKIKIGDFGMSVLHNFRSPPQISNTVSNTISNIQFLEGSNDYGTHNYLSPEIVSSNKYSVYSDIYSLGIIFYELLSIFSTNMEKYILLKQLREFNIDIEFKNKFTKETHFIYKLIDPDPLKRLTTNEILKLKNIINYLE